MNSKTLLGIAVLLVALAATWQLAPAQGERDRPPVRWEYIAVKGGEDAFPQKDVMQELNRYGDLGWELVAVEPAQAHTRGDRPEHNLRVFHLRRAR